MTLEPPYTTNNGHWAFYCKCASIMLGELLMAGLTLWGALESDSIILAILSCSFLVSAVLMFFILLAAIYVDITNRMTLKRLNKESN